MYIIIIYGGRKRGAQTGNGEPCSAFCILYFVFCSHDNMSARGSVSANVSQTEKFLDIFLQKKNISCIFAPDKLDV